MDKPRVLLLETLHEEAYKFLSRFCLPEPHYQAPPTGGKFDAIITRGKGRITASLMDHCEGLRVIARCGVGLDNIDVEAASARQIPVINAPGVNTQTVAEHTITLILMLVRNMYNSVAAVKNNHWDYRNGIVSDEITGKTLGIAGMGNIGRKVAQIAKVLGMEIIYFDPWTSAEEFRKVSLDDLLNTADVISLHLPLTENTRGFFGKNQITRMKPGAFLVNTSRGEIVDHEAVEESLAAGHLGGFAADVLPQEPPPPDYALLNHPNVLITPHSASLTASTYRQMCLLTVQNVVGLLTHTSFNIQSIFNRHDLLKYQ
ncbi:MAG: hydroxyacid dehydrogenase [Bacteroidia bacterium]|nr:hydroxyacid dehydrogenase [Bacteroidia bacterium]